MSYASKASLLVELIDMLDLALEELAWTPRERFMLEMMRTQFILYADELTKRLNATTPL